LSKIRGIKKDLVLPQDATVMAVMTLPIAHKLRTLTYYEVMRGEKDKRRTLNNFPFS